MAASRDGAAAGGGGEEDEDDDEGGDEEEARAPVRTSCSARRSREASTKSPGARVKACFILTKSSEVRFLAA